MHVEMVIGLRNFPRGSTIERAGKRRSTVSNRPFVMMHYAINYDVGARTRGSEANLS
jgi:hypothetical protein